MNKTKTDQNNRFLDPTEVPGLSYLPAFIDEAEELELLRLLDGKEWETVARGRVQNYGFRFKYADGGTVDDEFVPPPAFLGDYCARLVDARIFPTIPKCLIVNNYLPGEGIYPHIDMVDQFGPKVATLSLLSPVAMLFINQAERGRRGELILEPRSLLILEGEARYEWRHGIRPRKTDRIDGEIHRRERRISISFRDVVAPD